MSTQPRTIPAIVAGRLIRSPRGETRRVVTATGMELILPLVSEADATSIIATDRLALADLPTQEIVAFLYGAGQNWKSSEYVRRKLYIRDLVQCLGYSEKMAKLEANWIAMLLSSYASIYDVIEAELGNRYVLDEWIPREEAQIRAYPRGRSLHILPGNVPLSTTTSVMRALITKNSVVAKFSSEDPFTPLALAQSFSDIDPNHPIARAVSVVHWNSADLGVSGKRLVEDADVMCVWGSIGAIEWAARQARPDLEIIAFGPKHSLALIAELHEKHEIREAARALAHDVCFRDQRACFSSQQAWVQTSLDLFIPELVTALDVYADVLPRSAHGLDDRAARALTIREARFLGYPIFEGKDGIWTIIVCPADFASQHPLSRTLYLHPWTHELSLESIVDKQTQTVSVYPWSRLKHVRDRVCRAGAARIVECGMSNIFRPGGAHDGIFPLQRLVRFASTELPSSAFTKSVTVKIEQTKFLEQDRFVEFIP